jgi:hypothetical protein
MRSLVIIPCWRRPEFLAATLRLIERAREAEQQRYWFAVDRDADPRIKDVIASFQFPWSMSQREGHPYHGNSYNVIEAYRAALNATAEHDLIHLIEEDVFVSSDYFEFHQDAHALGEFAFVTAVKYPRAFEPVVDFHATLEPLVRTTTHYQSLGVSFRNRALREILMMAGMFDYRSREAYYRDPVDYCSASLPDSGLPPSAAEQDGLIHRVIRADEKRGLWPIVGRAYHAGFYGYNRGAPGLNTGSKIWPAMTWREQSERLLSMTADQMNALADPLFRDIVPTQLIRPRFPLKLI